MRFNKYYILIRDSLELGYCWVCLVTMSQLSDFPYVNILQNKLAVAIISCCMLHVVVDQLSCTMPCRVMLLALARRKLMMLLRQPRRWQGVREEWCTEDCLDGNNRGPYRSRHCSPGHTNLLWLLEARHPDVQCCGHSLSGELKMDIACSRCLGSQLGIIIRLY